MSVKTSNPANTNCILWQALAASLVKLSPRDQVRNFVMFTVYLSAILATGLTALGAANILSPATAQTGFAGAIAIILWFTVFFANFAESIAEGRGKAQAESLRKARRNVTARKLADPAMHDEHEIVPSTTLKPGDSILVYAGEQIPADGDVTEGAASVDESAITGESAPVIRESGGDRCAVTGGTTVLSDWLVIRVTSEVGRSFLDRMIAMVEGAARQKTPSEVALNVLLVALTVIFLLVTVSLWCFARFTAGQEHVANPVGFAALVALFVCLAPTTIGALLSAIGIAGGPLRPPEMWMFCCWIKQEPSRWAIVRPWNSFP